MKPLRKQENVLDQIQDWLEDEIYKAIWDNIKCNSWLKIFNQDFYEISDQIWSTINENT